MSLGSGIQLRRGFEPTKMKPNRFNSQQFSEPIISQGEINVDCSVDPRLPKQRQNAVQNIPRDELMGADLGENLAFVDIGHGEPLMIHRNFIQSNGMEKMFPKKAHVFSSVNGMYIQGKRRGLTQQEFERSIDFFGFSNGAVTFGIGKESSMKVSSRLAGSGTTENTGTEEFHIGDDIQWSLNSIDDTTRQKELESAPELQYKSKLKMGIVWRRVDYRDTTYFLHDALTVTYRPENEVYIRDFTVLMDADRSQHIPPQVRLGMMMRLFVAWAGYNAIVQALERGWVLPNAPADFKVNPWYTNYHSDSWNELDAVSPTKLSQGLVQKSGFDLKFNQNPDPASKIEMNRVKQMLAARHGFVGQHSNGVFHGSQAYLDTITARTLRGMITDDNAYRGGDISVLFTDEDESNAMLPSANGIDRVVNPDSLIGLLSDIQGRVGNDLYLTSVMAHNEIKSKNVLKSLSHAHTGEKFNYLLKIH